MREPRNYEAPLCAQVYGDLWFPTVGGDKHLVDKAKRICQECVHQFECAEWGIYNERHGIWGGLTNTQREAIRKQRKIVLPKEISA